MTQSRERVGEVEADTARSESAGWTARWPARPGAAHLLTAVVLGVRLALAYGATWLAAGAIARPVGWLQVLLWWAAISALGLAVLELGDRATRRLLPLVGLLRVTVTFPDHTPSRFRTALRAGSTRALEHNRRRLRLLSDDLPPAQAASALLELVGALSLHDGATRGHSERVRAYTELIAEELGVPRRQRQQLRWGGLVHDIGKLQVPAEVLNKKGSLEEAEWDLIRQHPLNGLALAAPLRPWLGDAVLAVSDHHERWDGGGYPSGCAGEDIALSGRIVAVADAFDVMTSARSYKKPITPSAARAELVACSGSQFDPAVVRAFLSISLPRLRAVLGPVSAVHAAVLLQWRWGRSRHRNGVVALSLAAATFVLGTGTAAPAAAAPTPPPPPPVAVSRQGPQQAGVAPTDTATLVPQPTHTRPAAAAPRGSHHRSTTPTTGTAPETPDRPEPQPPRPSPTPGGSTSGGIVIDPSKGTVTIVPPGVLPVPPPPLIAVPLVGPVACGTLGVCTPIVIPLPPLPLF